jgi:hypothetical protein
MSQSGFETPEQVLKFDPQAKGRSDVTPLDDAGQAIVAQIRTAADLANQACDRAMSLAHPRTTLIGYYLQRQDKVRS